MRRLTRFHMTEWLAPRGPGVRSASPNDDAPMARVVNRVPYALRLLGSSVLVVVVITLCFAPRFIIWRGLGIPEAWFNPELNRAVDTLKQFWDPTVQITNPSNQVINWRLFFPLLGNALHMPLTLFLALPHIGCVLAVAYLQHVVYERTRHWATALLASGAIASADWLFVSMGWLTYFDSWFVLGLLIVSFAASRPALIVTCLLTPWIDERFILALPVCLLVRVIVDQEWAKRGWHQVRADMVLVGSLTLPYIALRIVLMLGADTGSTGYLQRVVAELQTVPPARLLLGLWSGFRVAWGFAVIVAWYVVRRYQGWRRWLALGILTGQIGLGVIVAGDMSRNLAMLLPILVLGGLLLSATSPRAGRIVFPVLAAANLLLPAAHVVWSFTLPIASARKEWAAWREPPWFVNPVAYTNIAGQMLHAGRLSEARHFFENAIRLNPNQVEAHVGRGMANAAMHHPAEAYRDFQRALTLRPRWSDALYLQGKTLVTLGDSTAASRQLAAALAESPPGWSLRTECQQLLDAVRQAQGAP